MEKTGEGEGHLTKGRVAFSRRTQLTHSNLAEGRAKSRRRASLSFYPPISYWCLSLDNPKKKLKAKESIDSVYFLRYRVSWRREESRSGGAA